MGNDGNAQSSRRNVLKSIASLPLFSDFSILNGSDLNPPGTENVSSDLTLASAPSNLGPVTPRDTLYQIITDRFYDGDTSINDFEDFESALYDGTGDDLKLYQGGDWKGITDKVQYLVDMGIGAIWISAPYRNRESRIEDENEDGTTDVWTSYHGYHAHNYYPTHRFFGDIPAFETMRDTLHNNGIKLIIDFVSNHTSRWKNPTKDLKEEDGKLYEPDKDSNGDYVFDSDGNAVGDNLLADPNNDVNGWFHGLGDRGTDDSKFGYRHKDLGWLADFSHEHDPVVDHLFGAAKYWKSKGVDGFRHDATLHMNPAFAKTLKDAIDTAPGGPVTHFGEFFIGRPDPKYDEYASFPDRTGIHNLDFEYSRAQTNVFGDFSETMTDFGNMLTKTHDDYTHEHHAISFIDNHDVTRFRHIQPNNKPYHAAIVALMTVRGTPKVYYGLEQYVEPQGDLPNEGRIFMQTDGAFDKTTTAYGLIQDLSQLRRDNLGLAYGLTDILHTSDDVIVYERKFYDHIVVTAINRQPDQSESVPSLGTDLPDGSYSDYLGGTLSGQSIGVSSGTLDSFTLSGGEANVWVDTPSLGTDIPRIGSVVSTMGRAGDTVYIYGTGLGGDVTVKFGSTTATVDSNSNEQITATVPDATPGAVDITVSKDGNTSNTYTYELLSGDPVQVIFHVDADTQLGEMIHVTGNLPELGDWTPEEGSESFMNPNYPEWFLPVSVPKDTTFEFKFVKIDDSGNVTWEGGSNRTFTSPSTTNGVDDTPLYTWQS